MRNENLYVNIRYGESWEALRPYSSLKNSFIDPLE